MKVSRKPKPRPLSKEQLEAKRMEQFEALDRQVTRLFSLLAMVVSDPWGKREREIK